MSTSILWTCCECNDSTQSFNLKSCPECTHYLCTICSVEVHGKHGLSYDWRYPSETTAKASPEEILVEPYGADGADYWKVHDEKQAENENITNDTGSGDGCAYEESHTIFNDLNLHATSIFQSKGTESSYSPEADEKMDTDEEHAAEEQLWGAQKVELRKKTIKHQFQQTQEKCRKLADSDVPKQQQKTLSPYFEQLRDPACFVFAWEHCVLLLLIEFAACWLGTTYTINVLPGTKSGKRIILFMSAQELTYTQQSELQNHVLDMLPPEFHETTSFQFLTGSVKRTFDAIPAFDEDEDEDEDHIDPQNPYYYAKPTMGDSVGWHEDEKPYAATLGPCLEITEQDESGRMVIKGYWLLNFHLFESAFCEQKWPEGELSIRHPALADRILCSPNNPNEHDSVGLGIIEATSGYDCKTTRISQRMRETARTLGPGPIIDHVVVDWALSTATRIIPNLPRSQVSATDEKCRHVTSISSAVVPEALVFSSGRSSGFQYGQISLCPALLSGAENQTGTPTREWAVYSRYPEDDSSNDKSHWANSGIGIFGDSGASIIDSASNKLYGQVWGGHIYPGIGPRMAYFTDINDIFDHMKERYPKFIKIELARCDGDEKFAIPACERCHESQRLSQQLSEATRQVQSVELDTQPNSDVNSPALLQESEDSSGSLTARFGSPLNYLEDLEWAAEEISPLEMDITPQGEYSALHSSTNLTSDVSDMRSPSNLRSPSNIISPHPATRQDWLVGFDEPGPFLGSWPLNIDDCDLPERSDGSSSAGSNDRNRGAMVVEGLEGTALEGNFTYDFTGCGIKVVKKQKI